MPQLPKAFGPYPVSQTVDASGTAVATFQPNGCNARVSSLYVRVSTQTLQGTCTLYKSQIAVGNALASTNSGSTGAAAKGVIDIADGEVVYVVWQGADVGSVATVTFSGETVDYHELGTSEIEWDDPIAAGDGSLIYPALRSPDFVTGVSGWSINRDGSVEFSNGVFRGTLVAGGGNVTVSSSGIRVADITGNVEYLVNRSGGFAARNVPDNGGISQLSVGQLTFVPGAGNPTPGGKTVSTRGRVSTNFDTVGAEETFSLDLVSGSLASMEDANIKLRSEGATGVAQPYIILDANGAAGSNVEVNAEFLTVNHKLYSTDGDMFYCPMQIWSQTTLVTNNGGTGQTRLSVASAPFPSAFPAGKSVFGFANVTSTTAGSTGWVVRFIPVSNTNFALDIQNASGGFPAGGINVSYTLFAYVIPV